MKLNSSSNLEMVPDVNLSPTAERDRIQVLDLIRAIALLGIFLVNVEFFNRQLGERGLPIDAVGLNRWIGGMVFYVVEGKAWILFALLFGIGMAMTTMRSTVATNRESLRPYVRRIAGLALFGAMHCILLWRGDILFLYAISGIGLLLVLYCRTRYAILAVGAAALLGIVTGLDTKGSYALCLLMFGIAGLYVQSDRRLQLAGRLWNPAAILLAMAGIVVLAVTIGIGAVRGMSTVSPIMLVRAGCFLLASVVANKFCENRENRILWSALGLYFFPIILSAVTGWVQLSKSVQQDRAVVASVSTPLSTTSAQSEETTLLTQGTYMQNVAWRARFFVKNAFGEASLVLPTVAIFLFGVWFVRAGVIANAVDYAKPMRWMMWMGLVVGYSLTTIGKYLDGIDVATPVAGMAKVASGLVGLGSLPASLGVFAAIIIVFRDSSDVAKVRFLLPVGRLALTNYLLQSIVCGFVFYHSGLGQWGLGRGMQVAMVAFVFLLQILFSNIWLSRFLIGPCEWCLRAITYWRLPSFVRINLQ
jgi:uncharacterized protein